MMVDLRSFAISRAISTGERGSWGITPEGLVLFIVSSASHSIGNLDVLGEVVTPSPSQQRCYGSLHTSI